MTRSLKENLISVIVAILFGTILTFVVSIERRLDSIEQKVAVIMSKMDNTKAMAKR